MAEFSTGIVDIKSWIETEKKNFDLLDKDKNGFLEGKELITLASSAFQKWANETNWYGGKKHSEVEINQQFQRELMLILEEHDKNGDRRISFDEYREIMHKLLGQIYNKSVDSAFKKN